MVFENPIPTEGAGVRSEEQAGVVAAAAGGFALARAAASVLLAIGGHMADTNDGCMEWRLMRHSNLYLA